MAEIAKKRGIQVVLGAAELLPFKKYTFDLILIVASLSLFKDPLKALREAKRTLKPGGKIIAGILDKNSLHGDFYESRRKEGRFSARASFLSASQVSGWFSDLGFEEIKTCQTLYMQPEKIEYMELPQKGFGTGSFAVISARKPAEE